MKITVTLSPGEWQAAQSIGKRRQQLREDRGRSSPEYKDNGGSHMERNALGSVAEYALAKHYGNDVVRDWCDNKSFSLNHETIPCDVGVNLHVRATANPHAKFLVLHPYDPDEGLFIFAKVDNDSRTVTFVGWLLARDGKQPEYWNTTGPGFREKGRAAYTIDYHSLNDMGDIPAEAIR